MARQVPRVGMARNDRPVPLLAIIDNKPVFKKPAEEVESSSAASDDGSKTAQTPPKFKDSRSSRRTARQSPKITSGQDEDSDNERPGINIKNTSFASRSSSQFKAKIPDLEPYGGTSRSKQPSDDTEDLDLINGAKRRRLRRAVNTSEESSTKPQLNDGSSNKAEAASSFKVPEASGDHLMDDFGRLKRQKIKTTFGGKATGTATKRFGGGSTSSQTSKSSKESNDKPNNKGFIKTQGSESSSQQRPQKEFQKMGSSPEASPPRRARSGFKRVDSDSMANNTTRRSTKSQAIGGFSLPVFHSIPSRSSPTVSTAEQLPKRQRQAKNAQKDKEVTKPTFKTLQSESDDDFPFTSQTKAPDGEEEDPFSDVKSLAEDDSKRSISPQHKISDTEESTGKKTQCPWCGEDVDSQLLKDFSKGHKRLNASQQSRFCKEHKKHSAMKTYRFKSYPTIDWSELPQRIAAHHDFLFEIVEGGSSHFRSKHADRIEAGQGRSLKKEENLNPGYYGPRGFNVMCEVLVERFGTALKKRAVKDNVISGRGSAAFIQSVLVPELGVRLIMDDMDVSEQEAIVILEESKALGDVINEEV